VFDGVPTDDTSTAAPARSRLLLAFTSPPAVCGGALARSTDTLLARTTRRPRPVHRRATSHRVSGVEAREFATDEDDFVEVFLPGWFTCGPGSPGTGAVSKSRL
jgi:hypothetical protein